jgi:tRNA (guanine-N(7)-)-methyltransferase
MSSIYLRKNNSFARRKGKTLGLSAQKLLDDELPKLKFSKEKIANTKELCLEIGFGSGLFTANQALSKPDTIFIGCEPFLNGVVNILNNIKNNNINNIIIWPDDAWLLVEQLPDNILDKIYILFPDPWPKAKHIKRRLINKNNIDKLLDKLKSNGCFIIATDHENYANWVKESFAHLKDNIFNYDHYPTNQLPSDWTVTKYQEKALAGENIFYFCYNMV